MRNSRFWLVALCLWSLAACTDDAAKGPNSSLAQVAKLCQDGGAVYQPATSACVCTQGQTWDGKRCAVPTAALTPPATMLPTPPAPPEADSAAAEADEADSDDEDGEADSAAAAPALDLKLKKVCERAKATWMEDEQYCLCPDGKVLIGATCRKLAGRLIDDACLRAVHKGKWEEGRCVCKGKQIFNPARGGCVLPVLADDATLAHTCNSSLNNGQWDSAKVRCRCPALRVWVDELCQVQQRLPSAEVCEGGFNKGDWDGERKRCKCPAGQLWVNQTCQSPRSLPIKQVCESEWNGGLWNAARQTCRCPERGRWHKKTLQCTTRSLTAKKEPKHK